MSGQGNQGWPPAGPQQPPAYPQGHGAPQVPQPYAAQQPNPQQPNPQQPYASQQPFASPQPYASQQPYTSQQAYASQQPQYPSSPPQYQSSPPQYPSQPPQATPHPQLAHPQLAQQPLAQQPLGQQSHALPQPHYGAPASSRGALPIHPAYESPAAASTRPPPPPGAAGAQLPVNRAHNRDLALRGVLFVVAVAIALALAFSPIGDSIKVATADSRGFYSPKLVFVVCLLAAGVAMLPIYFVVRLIIGARPAR